MVKLNFFEGNVGDKKNTATQKDFSTDNNLKGKRCMLLLISLIQLLYYFVILLIPCVNFSSIRFLSSDSLNEMAWEDEEITINCPTSHYIHIIHAFYGFGVCRSPLAEEVVKIRYYHFEKYSIEFR